MPAALDLVLRTLRGQAPLRALLWGLLNRINYYLRTGDRRYEFERLYLEHDDPWDYFAKPYEREKYRRTLETALARRARGGSLLEIACSVGAFTRMASEHFARVTALDLSREVLAKARRNNPSPHVEFVQGYVQSLDLGRTYDVITCAEVLCYVAEKDAPKVCASLRRHLAPDGVLIYVAHPDQTSRGFFEFNGWRRVLGEAFREVSVETIEDPERPYEVVCYMRD